MCFPKHYVTPMTLEHQPGNPIVHLIMPSTVVHILCVHIATRCPHLKYILDTQKLVEDMSRQQLEDVTNVMRVKLMSSLDRSHNYCEKYNSLKQKHKAKLRKIRSVERLVNDSADVGFLGKSTYFIHRIS